MPTSHSLLRLTESLYGTPHLITEAGLAPILEYLSQRNSIGFAANGTVDGARQAKKKPESFNQVGEILIDGPITYKPIETMCGPEGTSYKGILEQASYLIDEEGVKTLVLTHSSPGGSASHCFSTANDLREMCDDAGVKLVSYIDTLSASASLALGIVADEVIIHPSASTGSIGCVVALMDRSKEMADKGVKPIYISSTPGKTPFDLDGSFSKDFLEQIQEDVTRLGNEFAQHVNEHSGIPVDEILAMNARVYHASAALEVGLVNKIMDHKTFAAYLADIHKGKINA